MTDKEFTARLESLADFIFAPANKYAKQYGVRAILAFVEQVDLAEYQKLRAAIGAKDAEGS